MGVLTSTWIASTLLYSAPLSTVGNGGNAVVCEGQPIKVHDLYEAEKLRSIFPQLGAPDVDPTVKVQAMIAQLESLDPDRFSMYSQWLVEFPESALFLPHVVLTPVPDTLHPFLEEGCSLKQLVIQAEPRFPEDKRYLVSKDLWDQLDNDNKAVLLMHEIVYRDAILHKQTDSFNTRYFVSYLMAAKVAKMTPDAYGELLDRCGL